jgi:hypothetical protein
VVEMREFARPPSIVEEYEDRLLVAQHVDQVRKLVHEPPRSATA